MTRKPTATARKAVAAYLLDPGSATLLHEAKRALGAVADAVADEYRAPLDVHRAIFGPR